MDVGMSRSASDRCALLARPAGIDAKDKCRQSRQKPCSCLGRKSEEIYQLADQGGGNGAGG